jgi:hypothetical protein
MPDVTVYHRVDRVLCFFSSRLNWDYPIPQASVSLLRFRGGGTLLAEEGVGETQFRQGDRHCAWYPRYICTLCVILHINGKVIVNEGWCTNKNDLSYCGTKFIESGSGSRTKIFLKKIIFRWKNIKSYSIHEVFNFVLTRGHTILCCFIISLTSYKDTSLLICAS